jgi:hypothetical protein
MLNSAWWPVFTFQQRWFTQSPVFRRCKNLPGFASLWNTIQKGAFAYNTLFLRISPWQRSATDLADITTLALFWGDEFIDGLADTAGKPFVQQILQNDPGIFHLQICEKNDNITLHYRFNLAEMLPGPVLGKINKSYGISYQEFYKLLLQFLDLINDYLQRLPKPKAKRAATKIADACNACLESFLEDVRNSSCLLKVADVNTVLRYHEQKTAYMQKKLLELRCTLADREDAMNSSQASGWLDIMRVVQVYDDIHDVAIDYGLQDNLVLSVAHHLFPEEWKWFLANRESLVPTKSRISLLSLDMPSTLEYCLQLASARVKTMNWEQQKIMHYLVFKNSYELSSCDALTQGSNCLGYLYSLVRARMRHLSNVSVKSFVVNTCVHVPELRGQLMHSLDYTTAYQLRFNLLALSDETRAAIFDQLA